MDETAKKAYTEFFKKQLAEMAKTVKKNYSKNQHKRENNIFLIFAEPNAKKYMGMGRSLDSQLGTRLQKIAFYLARQKYGIKNVPNVIVLNDVGTTIKMTTISYDFTYGITQKVYYSSDDPMSKTSKRVSQIYEKKPEKIVKAEYVISTTQAVIDDIKNEFEERDEKGNGIPIDLFYYENDATDSGQIKRICCYEVKAGGNLDTKNAPSNAKEVRSDKTIFCFSESVSKFATCYDGRGDGKPDGSIGAHLNDDEIVIGEAFWNELLEDGVTYNDFVEIYKNAYSEAEVEKILVG